ncbi:MAG: hypothetical protein PF568_04590 [Deltaproteobacteria bacterium]|nr:hypothetical protein [Deltaproteobacteria bacterium]
MGTNEPAEMIRRRSWQNPFATALFHSICTGDADSKQEKNCHGITCRASGKSAVKTNTTEGRRP